MSVPLTKWQRKLVLAVGRKIFGHAEPNPDAMRRYILGCILTVGFHFLSLRQVL